MLSVTVSMGVAERGAGGDTPALVLKAADEALYRAKQAGRNRVSR
jgi:diguanylate cyclase (GGDEF)-like protein